MSAIDKQERLPWRLVAGTYVDRELVVANQAAVRDEVAAIKDLVEMSKEIDQHRQASIMVHGPYLTGCSFWVVAEADRVVQVSVSPRWWQFIKYIKLMWVKLRGN